MKDCQTIETAAAIPLPEGVRLAMDDIAGTMREGLLAMAVSAGLGVMTALMEEPVTAVCGPKGRDQPDRRAVRHGSEHGSVALGGRRVPVRRPRVRAADGSGELPVPAYELFSSADLLGAMAMERMLAKLSCRRCPIGLEPVGAEVTARARSTPKSPASRRFVKATECALAELLGRDLPGLDLVALMAGRVHFGDHLRVVALGIGIDGVKHPLAVVEGATENTTTVTDLPAGLPDRGLDTAQTRPGARGAVLCYACVPVSEFGAGWPPGVPVQVHGMDADSIFVGEGDIDAARELIGQAEEGELFLYPGDQHYFADSSLPSYDQDATALLTQRVLTFLR